MPRTSGQGAGPVQVVRDGPFLGEELRRRPTGRIGGLHGPSTDAALSRLEKALGHGANLLFSGAEGQPKMVADWDACWIEDRPICTLADWVEILRDNRLSDVRGAFALAWLDESGSLRICRDAIGERTLYYAQSGECFLFASNLRALLATGLIERKLNLPAVAAYLTYAYIPGRETLIDGLFEVLPGEIVTFRSGSVEYTRFWSLPPEPDENGAIDEEFWRIRLRQELEGAVRRRLPSEGPAGAFLSGGLDSSLVVALACKLHAAPNKTFSISFGEGYANELPFSTLVARHCGTDHRVVELSAEAVLRHLDDSIGLLSDPIGDPLTVPNALLFREAARDVGVVLNGEGGDPCFGGPKNLPMLLAELFGDTTEQPGTFSRERNYLRAHLKCHDDLQQMLAPDATEALAQRPLEKSLKPHFEDPRYRTFLTRLQAINVAFKGGHHILPKVDALSAPFGVLPRSPLFDRDVTSLAFAVPPQLKLRAATEKHLLKQSVRDLLPRAILERPKSGMLVPVEGWFQGPLLPQARERLLDGLAQRGIVRRDYIERLLARRLGGVRPRHGAKIWLLITLESWLRTILP
jgi:asparagine synthase (glutamine-hydrolysing)